MGQYGFTSNKITNIYKLESDINYYPVVIFQVTDTV